MIKITNKTNLPLPIVMYLLNDDYDYNNNPKVFSATTLLKPTKKTILSSAVARDPNVTVTMDVEDRFAAIRGQNIHKAIEESWDLAKAERVAKDLGMFVPSVEQEERLQAELEVDGETYWVSGKFDAIIDGIISDWKNESVYAFGDEDKLRERRYQLSIYAWLCVKNGKDVNTTLGRFYSIFQDWSRATYEKAKDPSKYPSQRMLPVDVDLIPFSTLETWMKQVIRERVELNVDVINQVQCTRSDLWQGDETWQYFANATSEKSMKNFEGENAHSDSMAYVASKGKGEIRKKPQIAKACSYCFGRVRCEQYQNLKAQGLTDPERSDITYADGDFGEDI